MNIPRQETGAALLTVLLLVAVIAVLAAHGMDRLAGATKLAANSRELIQAKSYLIAAESIGMQEAGQLVARSPGRTVNIGEWNGREQIFPVPGGLVRASLSDGGNCFNINSLVKQTQNVLSPRPEGIEQFIRLMGLLDIPRGSAFEIAAATTDWLDTDVISSPGGAEDDFYLQLERPYRTANALMVDISEIRSVKGVSADFYRQIAPWICALPIAELSPININTLRPEQAVLLAMLSTREIDIVRGRQFLAQRPDLGYASLNEFWAQPYPTSLAASSEIQSQVKLTTRWFKLDASVEIQNALVEERALIDAARRPSRLVHRQRGGA